MKTHGKYVIPFLIISFLVAMVAPVTLLYHAVYGISVYSEAGFIFMTTLFGIIFFVMFIMLLVES